MKLYLIGLLILVSAPVSSHAETLTVITKQNAIRTSCQFFAPVKAMVYYNDVLEVTSKQGDWYQVKFKGLPGCIHKSAVDKKSFTLNKFTGSQGQTAASGEVALAGKGFNPQVEAAYKKSNPGLNYTAVNRVEGYTVSDKQVLQFIQTGRLTPP